MYEMNRVERAVSDKVIFPITIIPDYHRPYRQNGASWVIRITFGLPEQ